MLTKQCSKCQRILPLVEFYKDKRATNGLRSQCKECEREYWRKWSKKNLNGYKEKKRKWNKRWQANNKEYYRIYQKEWRQKNKEWMRAYSKEYCQMKRKTDPKYKVRKNYSRAIRHRLKDRIAGKNSKSSFDYLPYTIDDLIRRLEEQFQEGMTWDNYGKWHIDHIIPDIYFKYSSPEDEEFRKSWALDNLQPLWAEDNLKKGAKINK